MDYPRCDGQDRRCYGESLLRTNARGAAGLFGRPGRAGTAAGAAGTSRPAAGPGAHERDRTDRAAAGGAGRLSALAARAGPALTAADRACLLYPFDPADDLPCEDFGGRRMSKKKRTYHITKTSLTNS